MHIGLQRKKFYVHLFMSLNIFKLFQSKNNHAVLSTSFLSNIFLCTLLVSLHLLFLRVFLNCEMLLSKAEKSRLETFFWSSRKFYIFPKSYIATEIVLIGECPHLITVPTVLALYLSVYNYFHNLSANYQLVQIACTLSTLKYIL